MNLLADIVMPGHHFGQQTEQVAGSDAFVLMTLGFLSFLFGAFVVAGYVLWRRQAHPEPHRRLLMEMEHADEEAAEPHAAATGPEEEPPARPWEREADWWRK